MAGASESVSRASGNARARGRDLAPDAEVGARGARARSGSLAVDAKVGAHELDDRMRARGSARARAPSP